MNTVNEHYDTHLGPVYSWMAGGLHPSIDRGNHELDALAIPVSSGDVAVDLGCGFGMHAIPLARRGFSVLAIDACDALLSDLRSEQGPLTIHLVNGDLREFRRVLPAKAALILCMGDTITHMADLISVRRIFADVADALTPAGRFVISFRDYSIALTKEHRFIPVRSDDSRILTCVLEYADSTVTVYDILNERQASTWRLRVSRYKKLRLS